MYEATNYHLMMACMSFFNTHDSLSHDVLAQKTMYILGYHESKDDVSKT